MRLGMDISDVIVSLIAVNRMKDYAKKYSFLTHTKKCFMSCNPLKEYQFLTFLPPYILASLHLFVD